jgi:hypothetical protein
VLPAATSYSSMSPWNATASTCGSTVEMLRSSSAARRFPGRPDSVSRATPRWPAAARAALRRQVVGGIRIQGFRTLKIKECFSRSDSRAKGPAAKPQEPLNLFSFSRIRLSA